MSRELREGLAYLQSVAVAMHFLAHTDPRVLEDDTLGVLDCCERLIETAPASCEGWRLLGRIVRHVAATLEERHDARAVLLQELHRAVMEHADRAALARLED